MRHSSNLFAESDINAISSLTAMLLENAYDEEMFFEYKEWIPYVTDLALPLINSETGDLLRLPFSGSLMEQPSKTMRLVYIVQATFKEHIKKEMSKHKVG